MQKARAAMIARLSRSLNKRQKSLKPADQLDAGVTTSSSVPKLLGKTLDMHSRKVLKGLQTLC
jgi:hypothetical protein